jgi:hypothetical protein
MIVQHGGLLATLFVAGLAGSLTHCAGMCGPFVMTQTVARLDNIPANEMSEWRRLKGAALLPYHFGRITTYTGLGVLVSLLTQAVVVTSGFKWLDAALLFTAGVFFLLMFIKRENLINIKIPLLHKGQDYIIGRSGSFLSNPLGLNGYIAGVLLGFLPCGLLYSALLIASAADPATAGAGMLLFGLGTVPALFMVSLGTSYAGKKFRPLIEKTGRFFMLMNGIVLIALAVKEII